MDLLNDLTSNKSIFFKFMKEKYRLYLNSNIFFRDIQYAIKSYFDKKDIRIKYSQAEKVAYDFIQKLEDTGELKKMSNNAWKVNFSLGNNVIQIDEQKSKS
ncbi:MAG: hypothetical protein NTZ27_01540 [Ignavibacteriales bacterium]|nr:hypothetical protein [Ignavibacteriales bacterium]